MTQWATSGKLPYAHHWEGISTFLGIVRDFKPDIVHGHYLSTAALYLLACPVSAIVASAMGSDALVDTREAHARFLIRALPIRVRCFISGAPHVTTKLVQLGVPSNRIVTSTLGVDMSQFRPSESVGEPTQIISTRNLEPVYDPETLIRAIGRLCDDTPNIHVRLVGSGSLIGRARAIAEALGVSSQVEFLGRVAHSALPDLLHKSGIFASTSTSDGASVALLEAMASGLVPVVSDIEANRFWIENGKNGILARPGDVESFFRGLKRATVDEDLRARCFERNPRIVGDRASMENHLKVLSQTYEAVLS